MNGGTIAGLPDESYNAYSFDAVANHGNSGGPICDATGNVLGITYLGTFDLEMPYVMGIPHFRALPLISKCVSNYKQLPPNTEKKEWADVDELVSQSTVLIWGLGAASDVGISKNRKDSEKTRPLEDRWCATCYGRGTLKCAGRGCNNGTVGDTQPELKMVNPLTGDRIYGKVAVRVPCKTCGGKGVLRCSDCDHGIDRSLR